MPPSDEIVSFYEGDSTRIMVGDTSQLSRCSSASGPAAVSGTVVRRSKGAAGRLANVAFGGGIAAGALILNASAMTVAAAQRADSDTRSTSPAWTLRGCGKARNLSGTGSTSARRPRHVLGTLCGRAEHRQNCKINGHPSGVVLTPSQKRSDTSGRTPDGTTAVTTRSEDPSLDS